MRSWQSRIITVKEMNAFGKVRYGVKVDGRELNKDSLGGVVNYEATFTRPLRFRSRNRAWKVGYRYLKKNSWTPVYEGHSAHCNLCDHTNRVYGTKPYSWDLSRDG